MLKTDEWSELLPDEKAQTVAAAFPVGTWFWHVAENLAPNNTALWEVRNTYTHYKTYTHCQIMTWSLDNLVVDDDDHWDADRSWGSAVRFMPLSEDEVARVKALLAIDPQTLFDTARAQITEQFGHPVGEEE